MFFGFRMIHSAFEYELTSPLMTILSRQEYIDLAYRWLFVLTWFWTKTKIGHTVEPLDTDTPLLRTVFNVLTKLSYIFF